MTTRMAAVTDTPPASYFTLAVTDTPPEFLVDGRPHGELRRQSPFLLT